MRARNWKRPLALAGLIAWPLIIQGQFVAFNDHAPGPGTHPNTTTWSCLAAPNGGLLKNITNGVNTAVTLEITVTGVGIQGGSTAGYPQIGTPAHLTFTNYVDFVGTSDKPAVHQIPNVVVHYTFTGLDAAKRYNFKGSAVRAGSAVSPANYTNRWTKVSILGADSYDSLHTANVITSARQPTFAPNEVAVNFGVNLTGDMVVWDAIDPGADGSFEVTCDFYQGPLPPPYSATNNSPPYAYAITALRLEEIIPVAVAITGGPTPSSLVIEQRQTASFTIQASGSSPHYQWFRDDGQPISNAVSTNSATLTITNAQPGDSAVYRVRVSNSINSVTSGPATLIVNRDSTPPALLSGLGLVNGSNVVLSFSEQLDTARALANSAFHLQLTAGGGSLLFASVVYSNATNVVITTATPRAANANYSLTVDPNAVYDVNANPTLGSTIPLSVQVELLSFTNSLWKYYTEGVDLAPEWRTDLAYDETGWLESRSVFDAKDVIRTTVAGFPVNTQLPLNNDAWPRNSTGTNDIPTYYFRTH